MKRYFVSYEFKTGEAHGFGNSDITLKTIITPNNRNAIKKTIEDDIKNDMGTSNNINVVILNWRKYDFSLSLWIKDIFSKIRGTK